jgi:hypothetical protein
MHLNEEQRRMDYGPINKLTDLIRDIWRVPLPPRPVGKRIAAVPASAAAPAFLPAVVTIRR